MKSRLMIISTLLAALFCLPAIAQTAPENAAPIGRMNVEDKAMPQNSPIQRGQRDCKQSPNPEACMAHRDARIKAMEACKGKAGMERKQCMTEQQQNFDCSKSGNPQQCEARKQTYKACQGQTGPAFRQCVQQKMPAPDCSKAADPKRCELHQKARSACQDKTGPDHKMCLREQLGPK